MIRRCAHCESTVLFGGAEVEGQRYCNRQCAEQGELARRARAVPPEILERAVREVLDGDCPVCRGPGPVDVFASYRVLSVVFMTSWKTLLRISCRGCATKVQLGDAAYCFLLGWWGMPWGLVLTPVQVVRNLVGLTREPDARNPSPLLTRMVQAGLAAQAAQGADGGGSAPKRAA